MSNLVFRFATVQGHKIQWFLRRNCAITPVQLGWMYASLCVVSLSIGTVFWFLGALLVLPIASLELMAVGFAFVIALRVFVVIGGVTRILPLTGLTTPLLAAGGSSLLANWIIIAMLLRLSDSAADRQSEVSIR